MTQTAQVTIQYVNPRRGNRPASINVGNKNYLTIPDSAVPILQKGMVGQVSYYQNQKGFFVATAWNGQEFPKDQPPQVPGFQTAGQAAPQVGAGPFGAAQQPERSLGKSDDIPPILSNVLAHAIQSGAITEPAQLSDWAHAVRSAVRAYNGEVPRDTAFPPNSGGLDSDEMPSDDIPF